MMIAYILNKIIAVAYICVCVYVALFALMAVAMHAAHTLDICIIVTDRLHTSCISLICQCHGVEVAVVIVK